MTRRDLAWIIFAIALLAGAFLRLHGLGEDSLSHPEIYTPGVVLPEGISEPPNRQSLSRLLLFHFHVEPHPVGYHLAMGAWTAVFGDSETAIRMPSVLLALLSLLLVQRIGTRVYGPLVGSVAAAMLALHGFHLHWSQIARMHVPAAFLALLSTWLLLQIHASDRPRPGLEAGYLLALAAGLHTTELYWAFVLLHVGWTAGMAARDDAFARAPLTLRLLWQGPRLGQIQAMALCIGAIEMAHAVYRARHGAGGVADLAFLREYLTFGFLFPTTEAGEVILGSASWVTILTIVPALIFLFVALSLRSGLRFDLSARPAVPAALRIGLAVACALAILGMAALARQRQVAMAVLAVLPFLSLMLPGAVVIAARGLARVPGLRQLDAGMMLLVLPGLIGPLVIMLASQAVDVAVARVFQIFAVHYVILMAAGLVAVLPDWRWLPAAMAGLALMFLPSITMLSHLPSSPRDYKGLAAKVEAVMCPDDLILVRKNNWEDTPFFHYLPDAHYVAEDWAATVEAAPERRVWLILWPHKGMEPREGGRFDAVAGREVRMVMTAKVAEATLYSAADPDAPDCAAR